MKNLERLFRVGRSLRLIGIIGFISGVAVAYVQSYSAPFSIAWVLMIGGWVVGVVGTGMRMYFGYRLLRERQSEPLTKVISRSLWPEKRE